tara:strand:- start:480 stop:1049 length:570 start_codon:yes stop_codon:yes gene_type:complete
MASTLKINNLDSATGTTITVPAGKVLTAPGHVIQVVNAEKTDTGSASVTLPTFGDTGLSCTITPKFSTSKILVHVNVGLGIDTSVFNQMRVVRNVGGGSFSIISPADSASSRTAAHAAVYDENNEGMVYMQDFIHLDSPATTSAVIYKVQIGNSGGSGAVYINRSGRDYDSSGYDIRTSSRIVLQEIAQ